MYTLFQTLWFVANSATLNRFTAYGTSWNDVRVSFSSRSMSTATHVTLKTVSHDQTDGIYTPFETKMAKSIPYFRLEMLENDTLWGGTYLFGLYMGVPPPPPPPQADDSRQLDFERSKMQKFSPTVYRTRRALKQEGMTAVLFWMKTGFHVKREIAVLGFWCLRKQTPRPSRQAPQRTMGRLRRFGHQNWNRAFIAVWPVSITEEMTVVTNIIPYY